MRVNFNVVFWDGKFLCDKLLQLSHFLRCTFLLSLTE